MPSPRKDKWEFSTAADFQTAGMVAKGIRFSGEDPPQTYGRCIRVPKELLLDIDYYKVRAFWEAVEMDMQTSMYSLERQKFKLNLGDIIMIEPVPPYIIQEFFL